MRFVIEVVRRIRSRVPPGFAVVAKHNSAEFTGPRRPGRPAHRHDVRRHGAGSLRVAPGRSSPTDCAEMRQVLARVVDIKALDGVLELRWHTDQLHRLDAGLEPDLRRRRLATTASMVRRNGRTSFPASMGPEAPSGSGGQRGRLNHGMPPGRFGEGLEEMTDRLHVAVHRETVGLGRGGRSLMAERQRDECPRIDVALESNTGLAAGAIDTVMQSATMSVRAVDGSTPSLIRPRPHTPVR